MDVPDQLVAGAPAFTAAEVLRLVERCFGLVATDLRPLGSERDQMFLVSGSGSAAVLKISNPAESPDLLDMETRAMRHLAEVDPDLPVPRLVPTRDGAPVAEAPDGQGRRHLVRLLTVLPGDQAEGRPVSLDLAANAGDVCARVSTGLQGFFHAAAGRPIGWDIRVQRTEPADPADPLSVRLAGARRRIGPALAATRTLPSAIQHADLTLTNILRENDDTVTGVIDFGDMHHTAAACDLAVSMTSVLRGTAPAPESPWELAAAFLDGYQRRRPLLPSEAELLGHLVLARIVTTLDISRRRAALHPANLAYITQHDEPRRHLLELLLDLTDAELAGRFARLAGLPVRRSAARGSAARGSAARGSAALGSGGDLAARRAAVLGGPLAPTFYREPLRIDAGEGPWLLDEAGNRYLDAYNNVAVAGHSHPAITAAVVRQLRTLNTSSRYLHPEIVALAERLTRSMPDGLDTCVFVTSGTEAVDLAWQMARAYTGASGTIVAEWAYHGISSRVHDFSPNDWSDGYAVPDVGTFRAPHADAEPLDREQARHRVLAAAEQLRRRGFPPGILMVDPQFTSEGILDAPAGFMAGLVDGIHDAGGLFLADEVQSGFGRSGPRLWRFATQAVTPDLVTLGKPMGAGLPVAALVTRREIADAFARDHEYFSTFAGSAVACAAASSVLDVLADRRIPQRAVAVGEYLRTRVAELADRYPVISAVRGYGLIAGIDLRQSPAGGGRAFTTAVVEGLRRHRVLAGSTGRGGDVLKVRPPLVWRTEHVNLFIAALDAVLADLTATRR
jgi:4-aminobutyrate aminotransferase-like enzyme/Ser/Thr protein kinase RdoA (MazF antagonist)